MTELERRLGYEFRKPELLVQALTHKSFAYENPAVGGDNEKLEFLGDAVLDLVLGEQLMELFHDQHEGALSKKRASLVNESTLARVAKELGLQDELRLGKGESQSGGSSKPRLLASAWEALTGALFLDAGFDRTKLIVRERFAPILGGLSPEEDFVADFKTRLQEHAQRSLKTAPVYEILSEEGPPHDRVFVVGVKLGGAMVAEGRGRSKKAAEQEAAEAALRDRAWEQNGDQEKK